MPLKSETARVGRGLVWVLCCAIFLAASAGFQRIAGAVSEPSALITQAVSDANLVTLTGNIRPEATSANDRGTTAADLSLEHMMLQLRRSPDQEQALETYIDQLEDAKSPNYHRWLTAQEFGEKYGVVASDLATITAWLKSHGFTVNRVYQSGTSIDFSGNAGQVREAFHTEIHNLDVNGAAHIANMSDPQIPAALAPVVVGVVSLNDFRPHAMNHPRTSYTFSGCDDVTSGNCYAVVPADLATIYNLNPLFAAGYSGQGQTIVVLEDTDLYKNSNSDWNTFRSVFGLASAYPQGSLTEVHPGNCQDPGVNDADSEAAIDVEWSSAAAPSAAIEMASCADTATTFGGFIALANLLNGGTPPAIVSISYGESEAELGASQNKYINGLYQQAVTEGMSVFVSAGDSGAAGSESQTAEAASHGIAVSGFASTPYNVAMGGTDFGDTYANATNTYWSNSNGTTYGSALSYVPEIPWNDTCASGLIASYLGFPSTYGSSSLCNADEGLQVVGGSGGPSGCATGTAPNNGDVGGSCAGYAKPSWQSIAGNPNDHVRDLPDLSLFAADGVWNHYYLVCYSDKSGGGVACTGAPLTWAGYGGTSFAAPIMAAIQSLINEKTASRQGNPNPAYYSMATAEYGAGGATSCNSTLGNATAGSCIFYDVTQGDMDVPCTGTQNCYTPSGKYGVLSTSDSEFEPAYKATSGWNFSTGIGTVNAYNLVMAFGSSGATPTPTATPTGSATPTPTGTATGVTPTPTPTATATPTPSATPTAVPETLKVKPWSVNFGKVKVGHTESVTLKISNTAKHGLPVTFGNPITAVTLTSPQQFTIGGTNCPTQLLPKQKCKLTVLFTPASQGTVFSSVTIFDNAANANQTIPLQGTGK